MDMYFLKVLNMSISASWLVLVVLVLRFVLKKAPRWLHVCLWALVAVRLVCPVSIESVLSLIPSTETVPEEILYVQGEDLHKNVYLDISEIGSTYEPVTVELDAPVDYVTLKHMYAAFGWLGCMGLMALYALVSYFRLRRKVSASICLDNGVYICDYIETPFILGIVRPKIYLPSSMGPDSAAHVLAHERAHLKRRDHWWKPLGYGLLTVHWFNPVMWLAYVLLCRDIELACDEKVIREMGTGDKKAYSEALLRCSVPRRMIAACPLAFGEVGVKERVKSVLNYKKPAFWVVLIAIIACAVTAVCFLTDPVSHSLGDYCVSDVSESLFCYTRIEVKHNTIEQHTREEIEELLAFLGEVKLDSTPVNRSRSEERNKDYSITVHTEQAETVFYINLTCSEVWWNDGVKPSFTYRIREPERVEEWLEKISGMELNEVAAANAEAPESLEAWLAGPLTYIDGGYVCVGGDEVRPGMYSLEEAEISGLAELIRGLDARTLVLTENVDDGLVQAVLRKYLGNDVYFNVTVGYTGEQAWIQYEETLWLVEDNRELEAYLAALYDPDRRESLLCSYPMEEPVTYAYGDINLSIPQWSYWTYEIVEYAEGADSFGIRCRPKEGEGWLYVSYWPEGFNVSSVELEEKDWSHTQSGKLSYRVGYYDDSESWSYIWTDGTAGSYVVVNEDSAGWVEGAAYYLDEILTAIAHDGQPVTGGEPDSIYYLLDFPEHYVTQVQVMVIGDACPTAYKLTEEETQVLFAHLRRISRGIDKVQPGASIPENIHTQAGLVYVGADSLESVAIISSDGERVSIDWHHQTYDLDDEELVAFMEQLFDPGRGEYFIMGTPEEEPVGYSYGYANISIPQWKFFEYEIVEYTDEYTPFGIRCRPEGEAGWLYVSYWPDGFAVCGTGLEEKEFAAVGENSFTYTAGYYDGSEDWSYIVIGGAAGSYVLLNEDASEWVRDLGYYYPYFQTILYQSDYGTGNLTAAEVRELIDSTRTYYEELRMKFDYQTGIWTVTTYAKGKPLAVLTVDPQGTVESVS